jgi:hypothetical protein
VALNYIVIILCERRVDSVTTRVESKEVRRLLSKDVNSPHSKSPAYLLMLPPIGFLTLLGAIKCFLAYSAFL